MLGAVVAPVMAARETFQDWKNHSLIAMPSVVAPTNYPYLGNATTGQIGWQVGPTSAYYIRERYSSASDYCSADTYDDVRFTFYDSSRVVMYTIDVNNCYTNVPTDDPGRVEIKVIGGTPNKYCNGGFVGVATTKAYNPSYCDVTGNFAYQVDNYVFGETDHHVVRAMPTNWTVIQDLIDPASTGVYAQVPATGAYSNLRNSEYFYIDADTDSLDAITTENLYLSNPDGAVINTTVINSSLPHRLVRYELDQFITEAAENYGLYSVHFQDSGVYSYFTFTASGAVVAFDQEDYTAYDTATITYTVTPTYWLEGHSYYIKIVSASTGETIDSTQITAASGSTTYTFQEDDTNGGYYAVVVATPTGTSEDKWLATAFAQLTQYVALQGYVNTELGTVIGGADVEAIQGSIDTVVTTDATGWYNMTGFAQSVQLNLSATATGYNSYVANFIPLTPARLNINITLNSTTPTYAGLGIGGIVRDGIMVDNVITSGYGRPIAGATVMVRNSTYGEWYNITTNIAGWYLCDNDATCYLANNRMYDVNASKTGYAASPIYNVTAAGTL